MRNYILSFAMLWLMSLSGTVFAADRLIAVVMANSQPRYQDIHSAFIQNSADFCQDDCNIYVQTPNADMMSLRNAVRKAVALGADLVVTYGPLSTLAAKAEVPPVPTLFADVYNPVGLGVVKPESLTGRKSTGVRGDGPVQGLLKYFSDTVNVRKLCILYDTQSSEALLQKDVLEKSGSKRGIEIVATGFGGDADPLMSVSRIPGDVEGVFVANSEQHGLQLDAVINHISSIGIPVITQRPNSAELGAFMVLESSAYEQGEKLAVLAGKVMSGSRIADLPMVKPRQVSFTVNLKAARQYGIEVPIQTLAVASKVIR